MTIATAFIIKQGKPERAEVETTSKGDIVTIYKTNVQQKLKAK